MSGIMTRQQIVGALYATREQCEAAIVTIDGILRQLGAEIPEPEVPPVRTERSSDSR